MGHSVIDAYVANVKKGYMLIEDVPDRYREEVAQALKGGDQDE